MKIKALKNFTHFSAGDFEVGQIKEVPDEIADILIKNELAEEVNSKAKPSKGE